MKNFILVLLLSVVFYSCKKNNSEGLFEGITNVNSKIDAAINFEKFFVLIDNITNHPDTTLLKKFFNNETSERELSKFAKDLGFNSYLALNNEFNRLSNRIQLTKKHYPEFFQNEGQLIKELAREAFKNPKQFYKISFLTLTPYLPEPSVNYTNRQLQGCCPCTDAYNLTMDQAFWNAAIQTEICVGVGIFTGGLGGAFCMGAVLTEYYTTKHFALKAWDDCVTNG